MELVFNSPDMVAEICKYVTHPVDRSSLRRVNTLFRDSLTPMVKFARSRAWIPQVGTEVTFFDGDTIEIASETKSKNRVVRLLQNNKIVAYTRLERRLGLTESFRDDVQLSIQMKRILLDGVSRAREMCDHRLYTNPTEFFAERLKLLQEIGNKFNNGQCSEDMEEEFEQLESSHPHPNHHFPNLSLAKVFEVVFPETLSKQRVTEILKGDCKVKYQFGTAIIDGNFKELKLIVAV